MTTYYYSVPFTGIAIVRIEADEEEQARTQAASAMLNLGRPGISEPVISYRFERGEPKLIKSNLS